MAPKYGVALAQSAWRGWPLRAGQFGPSGVLHELEAAADAVLVWSGGTSEVTIVERRSRHVVRHALVRRSGMIDLLPRGTAFEEVCWRGQASACISVTLSGAPLPLLGAGEVFSPDSARLGLTDAHVVDLVQRLRAQALSRQPWGALYVESLSLALGSYVRARYGQAPGAEERRHGALPVEAIFSFVEEHLGDAIGLTELAAVTGYSPHHFARLFKLAFGQTPHQYVLERRVERAKSLLREPRCSLAEVALHCGFASQAHMSTAFKARTGVTPGAYRRG